MGLGFKLRSMVQGRGWKVIGEREKAAKATEGCLPGPGEMQQEPVTQDSDEGVLFLPGQALSESARIRLA